MTRSILISLFIPILFLSSCDNKLFSHGDINEVIPQDKQLLFFSDDENIDREAIYYDAFLELRIEFPKEFENMKIISVKTDNRKYEVDIYPSLLVIDKEKVIVHIEGPVLTKKDILDPVAKALSQ